MTEFEKIIIITQKTWLDGLVEKYNTKEQAKFYIEHMGGSFTEYLLFHNVYYSALRQLKRYIPSNIRYQVVDRSFLPNFQFNTHDLIMVLGRDGLVINTAKYLDEQPIIGINPDPERIEGVLLPFKLDDIPQELNLINNNDASLSRINIAQAKLNTNQKLLGVNDIFVGHRSHQSARYSIQYQGITERQSSSGIIVSTGVGSTGWFKSIVSGAVGISQKLLQTKYNPIKEDDYRFPWDANYLYFCVREPWSSKTTGNSVVFGKISKRERLIVESHMPENGVIFSDGIENDRIAFNSGTIAEISLAKKQVNLFVQN